MRPKTHFPNLLRFACRFLLSSASVLSAQEILPPSLIGQPVAVKISKGGTATFSISAVGSSLSYQWFLSSGHTATAVPYMQGSRVQFAFVTDGGSGYVSAPQVGFCGNCLLNACASASVNNGMVTLITLLSHGSYSDPPTIQIDNPPATVVAIPGQTNATLTIPQVRDIDETNYFVRVTNSFGTATSIMVPLVIVRAPQNVSIQNLGTAFEVQVRGSDHVPFILQSTTDLGVPITWSSILTNSPDASGTCRFTDIPSGEPQKFYRVIAR
jgi:hypothetical protein